MDRLTLKNPNLFYDKNDFPYLLSLELKWKLIFEELDNLIKLNKKSFWLNTFPDYVTSENNEAWKVFSFLFFKMKSPKHAKLCPFTSNLIFHIPEIISCDYSLLPAKTKINPHKGYSKMILRCHLPLIVPQGEKCGIKVGDKVHYWKTGELVIFDDSYTHEAWNDSDEDRFVLMFDIPNPRWGYSSYEISKYKVEHLDDPFLLGIANKETWLKAFKDQVLPLEEF